VGKIITRFIAFTACFLFAQSAFGYSIIEEHKTHVSGLERTEWVVQTLAGRFPMYRVKRAGAHGVIILAPPLPSGFQLYEASDTGDYSDSFIGFFALLGYEVWGYSQRLQGLPPGSCESGAPECAGIGQWGLEQLVDDLEFVRGYACANCKPVVGGVSLGSIIGYAGVNRSPKAYSGVIAIDGGLWRIDPDARSYSQTFCDAMSDALAAGITFDASIQDFKALAAASLVDPSLQPVVADALSTFTPGPAAFQPGYVVLAGSGGRLTYANQLYFTRVAAFEFVDYTSIRLLRDIHCSLAGVDDTWTHNLSAFQGKIWVSSAGRGFGQSNQDTAALATQANKTIVSYAQFGHVDAVYFHLHRLTYELPVLAWLLHP
jgi:pimeloyl-ACP methyl ester carboxylesterase